MITTSSETYANSLIETGLDNRLISDSLSAITEIIDKSEDFSQVMLNPAIPSSTKFEIIDEIFQNKIDEKIINFLKIIVEKNRFSQFKEIVSAYFEKSDEINNIKRVEIISAVELSENQKSKITEKLQSKLQKTVIPNWVLNEEIIGGLVVKYDDEVIDNSLKNKLEKISKI